MNYDGYYQLGHVLKTHGLAGNIIVFLDVADPSYYSDLDVIFLDQNGQLIPHFVKSISINQGKARIHLEDIDSLEMAETMVGSQVYLPIKYLPKLEGDDFYYHDLIGAEIYSENELLGTVDKIYDLGTNNLISTTIEGKEVMIPITPEIVHTVDLEKGKILVDLPDGLIDLYTKS